MRFFVFCFFSLFLLSCSSLDPSKTAQLQMQDAKHRFTIVAAMNRHLNLEPCGCTFHSQGGLVREKHVWDEWKAQGLKNGLFVSGGNTFEYLDPFGPKLTSAERFFKAETLVEGLNQLDLQALGITSGDFQMKMSHLRKLRAKSKFPWVASNLRIKRNSFLVPFQLVEKDGVSIAVLSLTQKPEEKLPAGVEWMAPGEAVQKIFSLLPQDKKHFVVVLSDLSTMDRDSILRVNPGINAWIGQAQEKNFSLAFDSFGKNTVYVHPEFFGRHYVRMDVATHDSWEAFRIPEYEAASRKTFEKYTKLLAGVERELASTGQSADRASLEGTKAAYQEELNRYRFVGEANNPEAAVLSLSLTSIDSRFDHGPNALSELVERYRQKVQGTEE